MTLLPRIDTRPPGHRAVCTEARKARQYGFVLHKKIKTVHHDIRQSTGTRFLHIRLINLQQVYAMEVYVKLCVFVVLGMNTVARVTPASIYTDSAYYQLMRDLFEQDTVGLFSSTLPVLNTSEPIDLAIQVSVGQLVELNEQTQVCSTCICHRTYVRAIN